MAEDKKTPADYVPMGLHLDYSRKTINKLAHQIMELIGPREEPGVADDLSIAFQPFYQLSPSTGEPLPGLCDNDGNPLPLSTLYSTWDTFSVIGMGPIPLYRLYESYKMTKKSMYSTANKEYREWANGVSNRAAQMVQDDLGYRVENLERALSINIDEYLKKAGYKYNPSYG